MEKVWKCDFCSTTNVDVSKIEKHEPKCQFNPANKLCSTCKHETTEWFQGTANFVCTAKDNISTFSENEDGDCELWIIKVKE